MRIIRLGLVIPTIFILVGCSVGAEIHYSQGNFNSISGSEGEEAFGASFISPPTVGMKVRTQHKTGGYTSAQVSFTTVIEVKTTGFKWRNNGKGTESVTWNAGGETKNSGHKSSSLTSLNRSTSLPSYNGSTEVAARSIP